MTDFSLSMTSGRRLCKIKGGKLHNKVIYLYDKNFRCCTNHNKKCNGDCCDNCCFIDYHVDDNDDNDDNIKYCKISDDGLFCHAPTNEPNMCDVNLYCGKRGSGKSTSLSSYVSFYKKLFPKNKVFLFSQKKEDDILDPVVDKRIDLDTYIDQGGVKLDHFKYPSLVIFDDIDMLTDSKEDGKLKTEIYKLMNTLIELGRSKGITVCQTTHIARDHEKTKHILNGCTTFTFFKHAISQQIKDAMKLYLGLSPSQIKTILSLPNTRQITIFTICPPVVMTDKELFILEDK